MKSYKNTLFAMTSLCVLFIALPSGFAEEETLVFPVDPGRYIGPSDIAIDAEGEYLYITEYDAKRVRKVKADGTENANVLELPFKPERLRLFRDGKSLAVVGGESQGRLLVIETKTLRVTKTIPVGHYPCCVDVFAGTAYVANRFGGDVSVIDIEKGAEIRRVPFGREPIALCVTPDGKRLVVVPHLPEDQAVRSVASLNVRIYDTENWSVRKVRLQHEAVNSRDVTVSLDGRYAFIPCILGHFDHVTNQIADGWMFHNVIEVIDLQQGRYQGSIGLDEVGFASGNPWGICRSNDGKYLLVASAGASEIVLVNLPKSLRSLETIISKVPGGNASATANARQLTSLEEALPRRIQIPTGQYGTRFVTMHGNSIYFTAYFEDAIGRIDMSLNEPLYERLGFPPEPERYEFPRRVEAALEIPEGPELPLRYEKLTPLDPMQGVHFERYTARLGPAPQLSEIRYGMRLFHDALLCQERWASCVSCHPDARADTLNWDLLNDGIGNPKNTKSMFLSHETPPAMVSGIRKNAETAVRSGFAVILFNERPENEMQAVDAYLRSLTPIPSPYLVDGKLSEKAQRGKRLFESPRTGCSDCHPAPLFTDLQTHDVDSWSYKDSRRKFDTPTLIEVWRTSPYLHDGRYITLKELILEGNHVNTEGKLDRLNEDEVDALIEYVLSL